MGMSAISSPLSPCDYTKVSRIIVCGKKTGGRKGTAKRSFILGCKVYLVSANYFATACLSFKKKLSLFVTQLHTFLGSNDSHFIALNLLSFSGHEPL